MTSTLQRLAVLAPSASNITVDTPFTGPGESLELQLSVQTLTVAGTSGVTVTFFYSRDGGSTWNASAVPGYTLAPPANSTQSVSTLLHINDPYRADGGAITHYRLNLSNLDATNAVRYAVLSELHT